MRRSMLVGLLFGFGMLVTASAAQASNILVNAGFETGSLPPWAIGNDFGSIELWHTESSVVHTGQFAATARGNHELIQDITPTLVSDISEVSLWTRFDGAPTAIFFGVYYSDLSSSGTVFNPAAGDWTKLDITSLLVAGKTVTRIGIYGCTNCGGDSRTYLDDVVVDSRATAVPEPASLTLLGTGLAVAARRLRRRSA